MMKNKEYEVSEVIKLVEYLIKIKKTDLRNIKNILLSIYANEQATDTNKKYQKYVKRKTEKDKLDVIGSLPFLLLNKKYFPTTESLLKFAESNNLNIPKGHKSRAELLGIIITNVAKLDKIKLEEFKRALDKMLKKAETKNIDNFFLEWEKTIREIEFNR